MKKTNEITIAILATDGFEEVELSEPRNALKDAGMITHIIAPKADHIRAWNHNTWGNEYTVDVSLDSADSKNYDALLLPGGVLNPDQLRMNGNAIKFIKSFIADEKPIAAICHGPQLLIETGDIKGKKLTSYPAIKTDLINAGVNWVDEEVVVDEYFITSRKPDDLPAFNRVIIKEFRKVNQKEIA